MINLLNVNLLKLQTQGMQQDPTTQAFCSALTPQFRQVATEIQNCLIFSRIDTLSEDILDELAWELHVDWYDATASIDVKRNLIKNSDKVHMHLGTAYAVEQVVQDYFGDGSVEEWFEYGGEPYMFRVITSNPSVTDEQAEQFTKAINAVKRGSAFLEQIQISLSGEMDINIGWILQTGDNIELKQEA